MTGLMSQHQVTRDFERALCQYTGAPYAVAVTSCTMALTLAVAWHTCGKRGIWSAGEVWWRGDSIDVEIPSRTYVSVPMAIMNAGGQPQFREEEWRGSYQLKPLPVWDSARWFTSGMYGGITHGGHVRDGSGQMACVSFHWSKTLAIGQGGAILHDNAEADAWLRRARFDGRAEGVAPRHDNISMIGWHCYMSPRDAAEGLSRLAVLPEHNEPLPNDDYPDLSKMEIFK